MNVSGGHGKDYSDETITCTGSEFIVQKANYTKGSAEYHTWEHPMKKLEFKTTQCVKAGEKEICDIEIAEKYFSEIKNDVLVNKTNLDSS